MSHQKSEGAPSQKNTMPEFVKELKRRSRRQSASHQPSRRNRRVESNLTDISQPAHNNVQQPSQPVEISPNGQESLSVTESFADFRLDPCLERAVRKAGFEKPTPIQSAVIPPALDGKDIIGTAQTGTGKTAAFVLPILQHLIESPGKKRATRVVVLTPTRELAEQVHDCFVQLSRYTQIRSATVYGGVGMNPQTNALRSGAEVIVACPGRLIDHMERGNTDFSEVETLVLDEADRMLDMGFLPQIKRILAQLPKARQSMLFSATFASELMDLARSTMNSPERIDIGLRAPVHTVAHALYPCPHHLKTSLILRMLREMDANSILIFTRTKHRADRVAQQIRRSGFKTAVLHADRSQGQRQTALGDFRSGRCQVLVATDIAARGLDVETISHVINYDVPDCADTYIHRIGRTGRAERTGDAMTLVTIADAAVVWDIEKAFGSPIERRKLEGFDYESPAPDTSQRSPATSRGRSSAAGSTIAHGTASLAQHAPVVYSTSKRRARINRSGRAK